MYIASYIRALAARSIALQPFRAQIVAKLQRFCMERNSAK